MSDPRSKLSSVPKKVVKIVKKSSIESLEKHDELVTSRKPNSEKNKDAARSNGRNCLVTSILDPVDKSIATVDKKESETTVTSKNVQNVNIKNKRSVLGYVGSDNGITVDKKETERKVTSKIVKSEYIGNKKPILPSDCSFAIDNDEKQIKNNMLHKIENEKTVLASDSWFALDNYKNIRVLNKCDIESIRDYPGANNNKYIYDISNSHKKDCRRHVNILGSDHEYGHLKLDYAFHDEMKYGRRSNQRNIDLKMHNMKYKSSMPSKFSLDEYIDKPYNQGHIGSCTACTAAQSINVIVNQHQSESERNFSPSRMFIYDNSRRWDGVSLDEDSGSSNYSTCLAINEYKVCDESLWPYEEQNYRKPAPAIAYNDASKYDRFSFCKVDDSLEAFKHALLTGTLVNIGVGVWESFVEAGMNGKRGIVPMPDIASERQVGGHSIPICGYDDDKELLKFINHWGTGWGDGGYGYLPYEYVFNSDIAADFCVISSFGPWG